MAMESAALAMEAAAAQGLGVDADVRAAIRESCDQLVLQMRGEFKAEIAQAQLGGARVSLIEENINMLKEDLAKQLRLIQSQTGAVLQQNIDKADMVCNVIDQKLRESETTINEQKERIDNIINGMNEEVRKFEESRQQMQAWSLKIEEALTSSDARMDQKGVEIFNECRDKLQAWTLGMEANIGQSSKDLEAKCRTAFDEILAQVSNQKEFLRQVENKNLQTGVAGGAGTGSGSGRGSSNSKLSPKDVRVDKLAEKIDVIEFRRWQKTVELQLEHCFGKRPMEELILALRHTREPITSGEDERQRQPQDPPLRVGIR